MSCYHLLTAFQLGINSETGKKRLAVVKGDPDIYEHSGKIYTEKIKLPCGQCVGCRLDYAREWANRIMLEKQYYPDEECFFLTLTYNDEHLPLAYDCDPDTGELNGCVTSPLNPDDLRRFWKRLRKRFSDCDIRYYACGEYGDLHYRPHYHAIVFGLRLVDVVQKFCKDGNAFYVSADLQKCWSVYDPITQKFDPIGYAVVSSVSWQTAAYVARYVMKKRKGRDSKDFYYDRGLIPEFVRMSLKPALGWKYFRDHADEIYKYDELFIARKDDVLKAKPPRYFDKLYDFDHPSELAALKENRKRIAEMNMETKLKKTSLNYTELLHVMEEQKLNSAKQLLRPLEV